MNVKINYLIYLFSIFFLGCAEKYPAPVSGNYGDHLILAREPIGNLVTGVYEENETCQFFFAGKVIGNKANMIRWPYGTRDRENTFGVMELTGQNSFKLYFTNPVSGCVQGGDFESNRVEFSNTKQHRWNFIRTVESPLVTVYETPDTTTAILDTLYRNHVLKVIKYRKGFAEVYFESTNEKLGWIALSELRRFPG